ncbi:MAG: FlgD immunoglobulin-like domain containing protein, partial [Candidatus Eiseniibacteriota bacterium]
VCGAVGVQNGIAMVPDGLGGAYIAWQDARVGIFVYVQHVLASGINDPAWPLDGQRICLSAVSQYVPALLPDGSGGAIVTWEDNRNAVDYDIYAQHVLVTGLNDPAWPVNGAAICTATGFQYAPKLVSDGGGGAIISWPDARGANNDIYAQHVLASGVVDPAWPVNGRALCQAANSQSNITMLSDDAGGAILTWEDSRTPANGIDVYSAHVLASGAADPAWPADGRALCANLGDQNGPQIATDGLGGAIVTWMDNRIGVGDIYAQHVLASGVVDAAWPPTGRALCTAINNQYYPRLIADGSGGAIVSWYDARNGGINDIYAQHVLASGAVDASWPIDGRAICLAVNSQFFAYLTTDGAGGAIIAWYDGRGLSFDIYAQHLLSTGAIDPLWPADGRALSTAGDNQTNQVIISDGLGGAIVAWEDLRSGTGNPDVYAQRIARFNYLGSPEGEITAVKDVANDNGGFVKVSWNASYLDTGLDPNLSTYDVLRSVPASAAAVAMRMRRPLPFESGQARAGDLVVTHFGTQTIYWELLGSVNALHYVSGYSLVAATTADSIAAGNPLTAFEVVARNSTGTMYWPSPAAYGYSVDNLPPAIPQGFTSGFRAGVTALSWLPNADADLAGYRIYRGNAPNFTPSASNQVAAVTTTSYSDINPVPGFYKLAAVDVHGNVSAYAAPVSGNPLDAPVAALPLMLELAPPSPNPAAQSLSISYGLPRAASVNLAVFDAGGRRVRVLAGGAQSAGVHPLRWDLRDDQGRVVPSGLYFLRLEVAGQLLTRRMVTLR